METDNNRGVNEIIYERTKRMKMYQKGLMAMLAFVTVGGLMARAEAPQDYAQTPAAHWHDIDNDFMKAFHNPMDGLEMGLDLRLREVYASNMFSFNDDYGSTANYNQYHWQRYRLRWSTKWALSEDVDFNTRLTWEFWGHCLPDNSFNPFFSEKNYDFDEAVFDHFNIQWRNALGMPLTLTFGRQDIILGTGWLVLDGTPADGSRTIYFDAIRGQYQVSDTGKLEMIYILQYDDESRWIPPINGGAVENRRHVTQKQDEQGLILYYTDQLNEQTSYDAYYMYKRERNSKWNQFMGGTAVADGDINVFGGRLFGSLDENWSYSAEGAYQFGRYGASGSDSVDMKALGANTKLMYSFNDDMKSEVHVGWEFLSGDDPSTSKNEQFNTMWGDWPQYQRGGDLQSYMWTFEGNLGEVSNLQRLGFGHSFKPSDVWTIATDYNLFWADENTFSSPRNGLNFSSSDSKFRGHMLTGLATYQCCKKFKTQFLIDYFLPGNYYADPSSDNAFFARINMEWTF